MERYSETGQVPFWRKFINYGAAAVATIVTFEIVREATNTLWISLGAGALAGAGISIGLNKLSQKK